MTLWKLFLTILNEGILNGQIQVMSLDLIIVLANATTFFFSSKTGYEEDEMSPEAQDLIK